RLESWKEIATFLGRGIRTVQRWEEVEGLPVHRHVHGRGGTVFAYRSELRQWYEQRESVANAVTEPVTQEPPVPAAPAPVTVRPVPTAVRRLPWKPIAGAAIVCVLLIAALTARITDPN